MTTPIQAAIEALTDELRNMPKPPASDLAGFPQREKDVYLLGFGRCQMNATYMASQSLAALQAAPAPGSIDTPGWKALVEQAIEVLNRHIAPDGISDKDALTELYGIFDGPAYRAVHIAQRAASGDEVAIPDRIPTKWLREIATEAGFILNMNDDLVVPAPHHNAEPYLRRLLKLLKQAAPAASAPDAPAGELLPLPEYDNYDPQRQEWNSYTTKAMHAYALADRAARAAVAPAGHAEPVAWYADTQFDVNEDSQNGPARYVAHRVLVDGAERPKSKNDWHPLFAAPVAAEPAPQVIYREPTDEERSAEAVTKLCGTAPKIPAQPGMADYIASAVRQIIDDAVAGSSEAYQAGNYAELHDLIRRQIDVAKSRAGGSHE
ncbi:hypothetical protein INH39_25375 [Massilia violaceinigra]|uniref:Uncharacterized protein n=1 Tax=Massilia violaceinigra TaxID=2045208 RepID=A0ABY4A1W6_9BURK|nr:hypothetical protein [Massilia violaceinigra]UOD28742.1 hypothetical protein INH39_25375 [Massilia violaceinigra]